MTYTKEQLHRAFLHLIDCNAGRFVDDCYNGAKGVKHTPENIFIDIVNNFNFEYNGEYQKKMYKYIKQRLVQWLGGLGVDIEYYSENVTKELQKILYNADDSTPFTVSCVNDWNLYLDILSETIIYYADIYNLRIGDTYAVNNFNDSTAAFIGNICTDVYNNYVLRIDIVSVLSDWHVINYKMFVCGKNSTGKRIAKGIALEDNFKLV